jgi:hypothetical protein
VADTRRSDAVPARPARRAVRVGSIRRAMAPRIDPTGQ